LIGSKTGPIILDSEVHGENLASKPTRCYTVIVVVESMTIIINGG